MTPARPPRIFNDPKTLAKMLHEREEGSSLVQLAKRYGCDHTSILYQIRKAAKLPTTRDPRIFDAAKTAELLALYPKGYTISHLARYFHCHATSVRAQLVRLKVFEKRSQYYQEPADLPPLPGEPPKFAIPAFKPSKYGHLFNEHTCRAKSYKDYLADEADKKLSATARKLGIKPRIHLPVADPHESEYSTTA